MANWNGVFVFDDELQTRWCKPTEGMRNEMDLTRKYIHQSQYAGYVLITFFSFLSLAAVGIYDSCISGKCDWCPSGLLLFCGRKAELRDRCLALETSRADAHKSVFNVTNPLTPTASTPCVPQHRSRSAMVSFTPAPTRHHEAWAIAARVAEILNDDERVGTVVLHAGVNDIRLRQTEILKTSGI
ncbi:unnamed protein product [Leuciscus chuanchicus]